MDLLKHNHFLLWVFVVFSWLVTSSCSDAPVPAMTDTSVLDTEQDASHLGNDPVPETSTPDSVEEAEDEPEIRVGFGEPCETDDDCESFLCLNAGGLNLCTDYCSDECEEEDWSCEYFTNSGSDVTRMCVPETMCLDGDEDGYGVGPSCLGEDCNDENSNINPNAMEICDEQDTNCDNEVDNVDRDNDGVYACSTFEVYDCDDHNPEITPHSAEICDGIDNNCDSLIDNIDRDEDGYWDCPGIVDRDCDDEDEQVYPFAVEICDEIDNNCNQLIDEGVQFTFFSDSDGDGYGQDSVTTLACEAPEGYVENRGDCNDNNDRIYPESPELCDSLDNNCNGLVDDEVVEVVSYEDRDNDGFGSQENTYRGCDLPDGNVLAQDYDEDGELDWDCNDLSNNAYPGAEEYCDNDDNDCNGLVDDLDEDSDGFFGCPAVARPDCDDENPEVFPGQEEICNRIDDNCNNAIDEEVKLTFYHDGDMDRYGETSSTVQACEAPEGYVEQSGDCDDFNSNTYPNAAESCDEIDNNCNGLIDDNVEEIESYEDRDGDRFGARANIYRGCDIPVGYVLPYDYDEDGEPDWDCNDLDANSQPGGTEVCDSKDNDCNGIIDDIDEDEDDFYGCSTVTSPDCDDSNPEIFPGHREVCNGVDDNCNNSIDEDVQTTFFVDEDLDGYGDASSSVNACEAPEGYVEQGGDCDDFNRNTYPGAQESCDEIDNDCNGSVDDNVTEIDSYEDRDNDGFGARSGIHRGCDIPDGYVLPFDYNQDDEFDWDCDDLDGNSHPGGTEVCDGQDNDCNGITDDIDEDEDGFYGCSTVSRQDCDDDNSEIFPGHPELCNGVDDNCNNSIDEDVQITFFRDGDDDGYGDASSSVSACAAPEGYVEQSGDCDDFDRNSYPDAAESCDEIDNDCNSIVDDNVTEIDSYRDNDNDGFGSLSAHHRGCDIPSGYVQARDYDEDGEDDWDCNDMDRTAFPGGTETCDNKDNDCNDLIDEIDLDQDGFFGCSTVSRPDCDDENEEIYPGHSEVCNGLDDNCNNSIDEDVKLTFFRDGDEDGFGLSSATIRACEAPDGYVAQAGDCNDFNININPEAAELCDTIDNNCNGQADDGIPTETVYIDLDGDGYGAAGTAGVELCLLDRDNNGEGETAPNGYSLTTVDCNDSNAVVYPGARELCDTILNDCDAPVADYQCPEVCAGTWPHYMGVTSGYVVVAQLDNTNPFEVIIQGNGSVHAVNFDGSLLWEHSGSVQYSNPMLGDMNNDGHMDVVLAENGGVRILNGSNGDQLEYHSATGSGWRPGAVFDLDNDQIMDVVLPSGSRLSIILRDGSGGVKQLHNISPPSGSYFSSDVPGVFDVDGDGIAEVIIGTGYSTCNHEGAPPCLGYLLVYDGATGELKYDPNDVFVVPDKDNAYTGGPYPYFADLDSDGEVEILHSFGNQTSGSVVMLWNLDGSRAEFTNSMGSSPAVAPITAQGELIMNGDVRSVGGGVVDLNNDGLWEVVSGGGNGLMVRQANEAMDGYPVNLPGGAVLLTDLNRDGRLDVLYVGSSNASLNCYTLGEGTYAQTRFFTNGSPEAFSAATYRTGALDPYEPNDVRNVDFDPEASTNPIVDSRAFPVKGFLDRYSSSSGWSRSLRGILGHEGDRDYFYAFGRQINVTLTKIVAAAEYDYDLFMHIYVGSGNNYQYLTTWSSERTGRDNIRCHNSTPCPDEDHMGGKLFLIEIRSKDSTVDYGPWPYELKTEWY